jgi:hypothetical protein
LADKVFAPAERLGNRIPRIDGDRSGNAALYRKVYTDFLLEHKVLRGPMSPSEGDRLSRESNQFSTNRLSCRHSSIFWSFHKANKQKR